jgi:hypothetical protein
LFSEVGTKPESFFDGSALRSVTRISSQAGRHGFDPRRPLQNSLVKSKISEVIFDDEIPMAGAEFSFEGG